MPGLPGRVRRRIGFDGNPLRRAVDRVEAWATLVLLGALVLGGPALAWNVGRYAYQDAIGGAAAPDPRFRTRALVTEGSGPHGYTAYGTAVAPPTPVRAVWPAPDGTVHSGQIPVPAGAAAGTTVELWTDAGGEPVAAPPGHDTAASRAFAAGALAAAGWLALVSAARVTLRRALDRHRLAAWQAAWSVVGPRWTEHR